MVETVEHRVSTDTFTKSWKRWPSTVGVHSLETADVEDVSIAAAIVGQIPRQWSRSYRGKLNG